MSDRFLSRRSIIDFPAWDRLRARRSPLTFDLEATARCNLDCRHCYINLPAGDAAAKRREMTVEEVARIAGEAAALGAVWCLLTGGEPLLREDFFDLYLALKKAGLLIALHTNATLVTEEHAAFLRRYPPRDVEVTIYGATAAVYETVTRRPGSFAAFRRGLDRLEAAGVPVRLKAMALRSNAHEMAAIAAFGRTRTKDSFRFDPLLHLRFDGDPRRNAEIRAERLAPEEVVALERSDPQRAEAMDGACDRFVMPEMEGSTCRHLIRCGAGKTGFFVGWDATFRLCSSLHHPDCVFDLRRGSLAKAWTEVVPRVRSMTSSRKQYIDNCARCPIVNLCLWCPAHAHLETGELDLPVPAFCEIARARAAALRPLKPVDKTI